MSNYKKKNFDLKIERARESKYNYIVSVVDTKVENRFEFRVDTSWDLKRFESSSGETIPEKDIRSFGFELYNKVFAGEVGGYFKSQLDQDKNLRIRLLISDNAPELITVPWEFLYDGEKFLATSTQTPILRLPSGTKEVKTDKITEPIKMLVIISSPSDQPELDMDVEEKIILEALDRLFPNKIQIDFEDEATWDNLQDVLIEEAYNIIHYTGHGVFKDGKGYLALESEDGKTDLRDERDLAGLLGEHQSLRLVFLSGCQTAKSSELKAFSGLSGALLKKGIPSVVAMQYSISDESAIQLARKFYTAIANNKPLDIAISEARKSLLFENGRDKIDFAIPALFSSDVNCLKTKEVVTGLEHPEMILKKSFIFNNVEQLGRNFFGRRKEIKRIKKGFLDNTKRAVIIHGFGGMGKSVLSTKLAERMSKKLDGVFVFKCDESKLGIDQVLSGINELLLILGKDDFNEYFRDPKRDIKTKISQLANILSQLKLLIIFDNFEVLLDEENKKEIANEDLRNGLQQLIKGVTQNTKFVFTCRYDFDLLERGDMEGQIDRINLPEFKLKETCNLINNFNELRILDKDTKRKIFEKIGGHPYRINLFARNCKNKPPQKVLSDLEGINKEVIDRTLLNWIYSNLSKKAQELLLKISVFLKDIPYEALKWMVDNQNINVEIQDLIHWGMMAYTPESELYSVHSIAKDFAWNKIEGETKKAWQIKAADFYFDLAKRTKTTSNYLDARNLYFEAGEFETAGENVHEVTPSLRMYGLVELAKDLNKKTIETTSGKNKAVAINDLGRIYRAQGDFPKAIELYNESLEIFEEIDDKKRIGCTFQDLGIIYETQGNYLKAVELYNKSIDVFTEIDYPRGLALGLYRLGSFYHLNDTRKAVDFYNRSLDIYKEIGRKKGIAMVLHALGHIMYLEGNSDKAIELYNESLDLKREVEDTIGIVYTLHELGNLCKDQGDYSKTFEYYNESLRVAREGQDKFATAITLRKLGSVYRLYNSSKAVDSYSQSLRIAEDMEYEEQIATIYLGLGDAYFAQGNHLEAIEWYNKSSEIFEKLGIKRKIAETRRHLGDVYRAQDDYPTAVNFYKQSLDIRKEIGDKRGTAEILQTLGKICQAQKEYKSAMEKYLAALQIYKELQSPDKEIVKQRLDEIKDEIGEELFEIYHKEIYHAKTCSC